MRPTDWRHWFLWNLCSCYYNNMINANPWSVTGVEILARRHYCFMPSCKLGRRREYIFWNVFRFKKERQGVEAQEDYLQYTNQVEKMGACWMPQSKLDLLLFNGENIKCISYVYDLLLCSKGWDAYPWISYLLMPIQNWLGTGGGCCRISWCTYRTKWL